eukprot:CAMPEP_0198155118 /NCGR_PEP_ID=MMETSP1443-20131203/68971_1 /TAXON_ID=186043 /ORGANISM="Entomoneis sp., Strain CCMP2396" /LENGTH=48 /DNA_ID= /DNA_START= /DNA_END= /DNA_ORIENTATION=
METSDEALEFPARRRLEENGSGGAPSYMGDMMKDLEDRKKLFRESQKP